MMDFLVYIDPALLVLIPVLNLMGWAIKKVESIDSRHIPLILLAVGIVLSVLWVLAGAEISGYRDVLLAVFTALVQGILCAGAAVLGNQIAKQESDCHE